MSADFDLVHTLLPEALLLKVREQFLLDWSGIHGLPHWMQIHDLCAVWMTAMIWVVQVLLYPNFRDVPESAFRAYHQRHCRRIALLVAPMFLQALGAGALIARGIHSSEWIFHASVITANMVLTGTLFAPLHQRLEQGKNADLIARMIRWNWIRTGLWSSQCLYILAKRVF